MQRVQKEMLEQMQKQQQNTRPKGKGTPRRGATVNNDAAQYKDVRTFFGTAGKGPAKAAPAASKAPTIIRKKEEMEETGGAKVFRMDLDDDVEEPDNKELELTKEFEEIGQLNHIQSAAKKADVAKRLGVSVENLEAMMDAMGERPRKKAAGKARTTASSGAAGSGLTHEERAVTGGPVLSAHTAAVAAPVVPDGVKTVPAAAGAIPTTTTATTATTTTPPTPAMFQQNVKIKVLDLDKDMFNHVKLGQLDEGATFEYDDDQTFAENLKRYANMIWENTKFTTGKRVVPSEYNAALRLLPHPLINMLGSYMDDDYDPTRELDVMPFDRLNDRNEEVQNYVFGQVAPFVALMMSFRAPLLMCNYILASYGGKMAAGEGLPVATVLICMTIVGQHAEVDTTP